MSIKQFQAELKKGMPKPAYLLHSTEAYLLREAGVRLRALVPEENKDFCLSIYDFRPGSDASAADPGQMVETLNTLPFMGGRQVVIAEGVEEMKAAPLKIIAAYLTSPSPSSLLVMLYLGKLEKTPQKYLAEAHALALTVYEGEVPGWLTAKAAALGFTLAPDAVEYLIGTLGTDLGILAAELEKYAQCGKKSIARQDVVELSRGLAEYTPFDLVQALEAKDHKRAFRIYKVLSETEEPYAILGGMNWKYEQMLGQGGQQKASPRRARIFALLSEADYLVKSSGGAYPLEHLLVRLLRA